VTAPGRPSEFRWNDLELVKAVMDQGSLGRAAAQLGMSQSTASRRLTDLESTLRVQLFDRTVDGALPTDAARALLPLAEQMQELAAEVGARVEGRDETVEGQVRIAIPEGLEPFLIPNIPLLQAEHPGIDLDLRSGVAYADMTRNEADLAVRFTRPAHGPFVVQRIGTVEYAVFVHHEKKSQFPVLSEARWVSWSTGDWNTPDATWLTKNYPSVHCPLRVGSVMAILRAVQAGVGVALLPRGLGESTPELVEIPVKSKTPVIPVWLVIHKEKSRLARIRVVADFLVDLAGRSLQRSE